MDLLLITHSVLSAWKGKCVWNSNCHCFGSVLLLAQDTKKTKHFKRLYYVHYIISKLDSLLEDSATKSPCSPAKQKTKNLHVTINLVGIFHSSL